MESLQDLERRIAGARSAQAAARTVSAPCIIPLAGPWICRRVAVVGNGGIALELMALLRGIEVVWAVKHEHIGDAFFDRDAAEFLLEELQAQHAQQGGAKRLKLYDDAAAAAPAAGARAGADQREGSGSRAGASGRPQPAVVRSVHGHAVGPRWSEGLRELLDSTRAGRATKLRLETGCEVASVEDGPEGWPVRLRLVSASLLLPCCAPVVLLQCIPG